ncbi:DUF756 domain-containing protein [Streptomyces armeniacus]|uniref:exo-alpha-sialidase n=1 Tax=Streptomyces armeniacus TaxID=83291 RepID=A0A345XMG2_9ACTN|nr:DUF756 domain-containing protein [Streptomyces armeniacus]
MRPVRRVRRVRRVHRVRRVPESVRSWLACGAAAVTLGAALPALAPSAAYAGVEGLSARVSADCTEDRLQLFLGNATDAEQTFTVNGPDPGVTSTETVPAGGSATVQWDRARGAAYALRVSTPGGYRKSASGTFGCGLRRGEPRMTTTTVFTTGTRFKGLVDAHGKEYDGTSASVRIPAMAVTNDGTILAVTDARVTGPGDLGVGDNNIQLGLRRSTDRGATWTAPEIVAHGATSETGKGDASLLVDRQRDRVYLFYNRARKGVGYHRPPDGSGSNSADDPDSMHVEYVTSDDAGVTWSEPRDLNPYVKDPSWKGVLSASGHGIQTSGGRLLQPIVYRDDKGGHPLNVYSDDHGRTWHAGSAAGNGYNESKPVERSDGRIAQNMRSDLQLRRFYAVSPDGISRFGEPTASELIDPRVNADEISYVQPDADGVDPRTKAPLRTATVLFSNPASSTSRTDLTVRLSEDDGASWPYAALLKPGTAGYSTMAVLDDGSVGALYEIGGTGGIRFARFTLDWIREP